MPFKIFSISSPDVRRAVQKLFYPFLKSLVGGAGLYANFWLVESLCSPKDFILYRNGARELPLSLILANSFSASANALLSKTLALSPQSIGKALARLKKESRATLHFMFTANLLFLALSAPLFEFILPSKFITAARIFDFYLLLVIARALFPQSIVSALGLWKQSFWITFSECFLYIFLTYLFIQSWGIEGAALATFIAFLLEKLMLALLLKRRNIAFRSYTPASLLLGYSCLLVLLFIWKHAPWKTLF